MMADNNEEDDDELLPDTLDDAQREIIRLREFRKKKDRMIKEQQEEVEKRFKYAPSFLHICDNIPYFVDSDGLKVPFPDNKIVGLYFGMSSCAACRKFEATLSDFCQTNNERGFMLVYIPFDSVSGQSILDFGREINIYSLPDESIAHTLRKLLKITMFPTMLVVDPGQGKVVTRFGREAVEAEKLSGHALNAWKNGYTGYFPEFLERRRMMHINPLSVIIWWVGTYVFLHYMYGFSIIGSILFVMKWVFYKFIDPSNNPDVVSKVVEVAVSKL